MYGDRCTGNFWKYGNKGLQLFWRKIRWRRRKEYEKITSWLTDSDAVRNIGRMFRRGSTEAEHRHEGTGDNDRGQAADRSCGGRNDGWGRNDRVLETGDGKAQSCISSEFRRK